MNGTQVKSGRKHTAGDEVREVLDSIRRIVRLLRLASREAEREVGLSGAQLFVLQKLAEAKMLSVNDLAERTHTHQSSVSVVAQTLVDKGLIARSRAADDARRLELTLTPQAKALVRKSPGAAQGRLIEAVEGLPAVTRKQLASSLAKLVEEAGLGDEEAPMVFEDGLGSKKSGRAKAAR
ncbi:MAG TPA: MarR family winged helix-turn-helix transcriptional regulator [Tepidisphaeraceae bacterium]|jgi:DNA-binding MarR family transcriptional regulator|nr:MarR family winged helix-turn-helix transcriptional regulator [Tepidisphaeraceae bacterium]